MIYRALFLLFRHVSSALGEGDGAGDEFRTTVVDVLFEGGEETGTGAWMLWMTGSRFMLL